MNIEAKEYKIEMTYKDLWSTAWDIMSALNYTLKNHWVNHQDSWKRNEEERLVRLRIMFYALGRPEMYDQIYKEAESVFKEFNEKTIKKTQTK